jgi:NAD+ synthase
LSQDLVVAIAQIDPTVGDIAGNLQRILDARRAAAAGGASLVVLSELVVAGYPPDDLVLKPAFQDHCRDAVLALAAETADGGPAVLLGAPWRDGASLHNAALLLAEGRVQTFRAKHDLPNYGVFDEKRVFAAGPVPGPIPLRLEDGRVLRLGVMICEDMWTPDVAEGLAESGAEILIVINASPFESDKPDQRLQLAVARVTETGLPLVYVNQVGGQDELCFDGASFVLGADRRLRAQAPSFAPHLLLTRWRRDGEIWDCTPAERVPPPGRLEAIWRAMALGLADYVDKNRFPGVVLGLSGGIDSALSAVVAVDALGASRVHAVMMPSRFTAAESLEDAAATASRLGIRLDTVPIEPGVAAFDAMLAPLFAGRERDVTEENIQSRIRGVLLMALSNKLGHMVLTTGNKSEMSVGYATLYGDMCGGYSVLKDVYKTTVYALASWRNAHHPAGLLGPGGEVVPARVLTRAPTAELREDQTDQDSLPPYEVLDAILEGLIEHDLSPRDLVARGHDPAVVRKVSNLLDSAEYKRRQAPPGVKLTRKAFGRDRRYPITNAFRRVGLAATPAEAPAPSPGV